MKINLRLWTTDDIVWLVKNANNKAIFDNMTDGFPFPYTAKSAKAFVEMTLNHTPRTILAIEFDEELAGSIGIHLQHDIYSKNAEMGYWLAEQFWEKGIISVAIKQMTKYTFDNFQITRIFARPFGRNIGSQKALEKAGFELEAKFKDSIFKNGTFEDEYIYSIKLKS